ncbi:MAG: aldo/keto reductase [Sandaracinaceae bacterium]|nr:aldo/keto reductase [Sandaracinaceae bacterium]
MDLPRVIFGAMGVEDEDVVRACVDAGYRAFDTAPLYGFGASERLLGRALRGREDVLVLTKVGLSWDGTHGEVLFATPERVVRKDSRPESVLREIDQSLERLGRDHLDLVQVHQRDPLVPIAETMDALRGARDAGKVRAIGVSNYSARELREAQAALGEVGLASAQSRYNLLEREVEDAVLPACRALGCAFLAYSPLSQGVLAGSMRGGRRLAPGDWRAEEPKLRPAVLAQIHAALDTAAAPVAARCGVSEGAVALAWLLGEPGVTSAIAGARSRAQAAANLAAGSLALREDERSRLRRAFEAIRVPTGLGAGARAKRLARRALGRLLGDALLARVRASWHRRGGGRRGRG